MNKVLGIPCLRIDCKHYFENSCMKFYKESTLHVSSDGKCEDFERRGYEGYQYTKRKNGKGLIGKAILVIDMPEKCSMCKFLNRTDEGYCYCGVFDFDYQVNQYMSTPKGKPDWCPLKELPERKEEVRYFGNGILGINDMSKSGFNEGWNDCLDEILKERD